MFIYVDKNGLVKEIIGERPFRGGDSARDKLYIYYENAAPESRDGYVQYVKADGTTTILTQFFDKANDSLVGKELPLDPLRNLEHFNYNHTYEDEDGNKHIGYLFYELTIPDEVLASATPDYKVCSAIVKFVLSGEEGDIDQLGAIVFSVDGVKGILPDNSINETEFNYLLKLIGNTSPIAFLKTIKQIGFTFEIENKEGTKFKINSFNGIKINKRRNFFYEAEVLHLDYDFAKAYLDEHFTLYGACSSVRKGSIYARNFDFYYSNNATYFVRVPKLLNRHGSIGVGNSDYNPDFKDDPDGTLAKVVPFLMLDGMNDMGVIASINIVADNLGNDTHIYNAQVEEREKILATMLVRYILDNFDSATQAVNYIRDYVTVIMPKLKGEFMEMHFMVGDMSNTYLIEFIGDRARISEYGVDLTINPILTNFYESQGVNFNPDGSVTIDNDDREIPSSGITLHGQGLERFNDINAAYDSLSSIEDYKLLLSETLRYTRMYTEDDSNVTRKTEFVGIEDTITHEVYTITQNPNEQAFIDFVGRVKEVFNNRDRDNPITWQTIHSSIYDMEHKKLYLQCQEVDEWFEYSMESGVPTRLSQLENDVGFVTDDDLPTKTSDLINDSGFIDNLVNNLLNYYLKSETYTKTEVNSLVDAIKQLEIVVVTTLPTPSEETYRERKIYLYQPSGASVYEEYVIAKTQENTYILEKIGDTDIKLANYYTKSESDKTFQAISTLDNDITALGYIKSVDFSNYYNKSEIDGFLANKVDNSTLTNYYIKSEVDNLVNSVKTRLVSISKDTANQVITITDDNGIAVSFEYGSGSGGTSDYDDLINKPKINNVELSGSKTPTELKIADYVEITYSELKTLRDNNQLIKGTQYRITDYSTIIYSDTDVQSAGHNFDIIVVADSENVLNENARAIQHTGDTYFANNKLSAWKLKYSLDNDTNRFAWANASGKGVIYEMIDEFNNKCPYDFKNIQFKRYKLTATTGTATDLVGTYSGYKDIGGSSYYPSNFTIDKEDSIWCYTFDDSGTDISLLSTRCYNNEIKKCNNQYEFLTYKLQLNNIVFNNNFFNVCGNKFGVDCRNMNFCNLNSIGGGIEYNTFGNYCHSNTFGNSCNSNTFGNSCYSNTFGNSCYSNTFGNSCYSNTFGNSCNSNTFGNSCYSNTFGNDCYYNTFGNSCYSNTFGNSCNSNTFGNSCYSNTFGNSCYSNTFGNSCYSNTFGNSCYSNTLLDNAQHTKTEQYARYNIFENGVSYVSLVSNDSTSTNYLQNIHITQGVVGTSGSPKVITETRNLTHNVVYRPTGSEDKNI